MATTFETGKKYHQFEIAGLGQAPYEFIGCRENLFVSGDGSVRKPGGSCDYCGTGILYEFWLRSADGKKFKVGCDCVLKTDSDKALRVAVENERQQIERQKREAKRAAKFAKDSERVTAAAARLPEVADTFRVEPHPMATGAGANTFFCGQDTSRLGRVDAQECRHVRTSCRCEANRNRADFQVAPFPETGVTEMTTTLKQHPHFDELLSSDYIAIDRAQALSDARNSPVGVWERDGWYAISDVAPECFEPDFQEPEDAGWTLHALVDPTNWE